MNLVHELVHDTQNPEPDYKLFRMPTSRQHWKDDTRQAFSLVETQVMEAATEMTATRVCERAQHGSRRQPEAYLAETTVMNALASLQAPGRETQLFTHLSNMTKGHGYTQELTRMVVHGQHGPLVEEEMTALLHRRFQDADRYRREHGTAALGKHQGALRGSWHRDLQQLRELARQRAASAAAK